jgi:hypothetical protein
MVAAVVKPMNVFAAAQDRSCSKESDAGHHLRRDAVGRNRPPLPN